MKIPSYLTDNTLAFPYRLRVGSAEEIPFADTFTINRVLGGYPLAWLQRYHLAKSELGRQSLDYAINGPNGGLLYQPDLIKARLAPYLEAGYKPGDITLALDNVPWSLSTPNGSSPQEGPWGRKTPPGDWKQWQNVVSNFARDLEKYLGSSASDITFETGIEYNNKQSFDGTQADFLNYYKNSYEAIRQILPKAAFHPGEFAGTGICDAQKNNCSYDVKAFIADTMGARIAPQVIPRSLHQLANTNNPWPSLAAKAFRTSYARLAGARGSLIPEVHQFGLLFQPFGKSGGRDPGAMQASWEFQTLMLLLENGPPEKVYHWATFETVGGHDILNGSGFDMLVLDHYLGSTVVPVEAQQVSQSQNASEILAVEFRGISDSALAVSNFTPRPQPGTTNVAIKLPPKWAAVQHVKVVNFAVGEDIFSIIKADLAAEEKLKSDFIKCSLCEGSPTAMATTSIAADRLIKSNWNKYASMMSEQLHWHVPDTGVIIQNGRLALSLRANEVVVIEPDQRQ